MNVSCSLAFSKSNHIIYMIIQLYYNLWQFIAFVFFVG